MSRLVERTAMYDTYEAPDGRLHVVPAGAPDPTRRAAEAQERAERERQAREDAEAAAREQRQRIHTPWLDTWPTLQPQLQQDVADARQRMDASLAAQATADSLTAALDLATATVVLSRARQRTARAREATAHNRGIGGPAAAKPELPAEFTRMAEALIAQRAEQRFAELEPGA